MVEWNEILSVSLGFDHAVNCLDTIESPHAEALGLI